jgi:O-glycosyl hydrolase
MMKKNKKPISFGYPACVFLILIPLLGTSYGNVGNILVNPDFESGTTGWVARSCSITTVTSSPTPYSGTRCARAYSRTATWNGIQQDIKDKVAVGQTYQISGRVRTSTSVSSTVKISIQKTDNGTTTYATVASGTASSSGWVLLSGSYTVPEVDVTRTELYVYFEGPASGIDIYVDDANVFGEVPGPNATGQVNFTVTHQTLEGFGAAGAWGEGTLTDLGQPSKHPEIYDILFGDLGLDIYRLRNAYDEDGGAGYMSKSGQIVSAAGASLGHPIKVLISAWSPPDYLKSNGDTSNGGTLIGGPSNYDYTGLADWLADSITAWSGYGVDADYISMQNEPDYAATWDSCRYEPAQTTSYAGYNQAFEAVYNELYSRMGSSMPKMIGPETTGFNGAAGSSLSTYLSAIIDHSHVYGYAHHLYNINAGDNPDAYISAMQSFNSSWGTKPLFQTEYEKASNPSAWPDAYNLALLLHNSLTIEEVSGYFYWDLFWYTSSVGLVSITSSSYTINSDYYGFKHYSKFTDPGWQRVDANTDSSNLRISAYKDPCEPNASVMIINTSATTDVNLTLSLAGFTPQNSEIYQSKSDANFAYIGTFGTSTPVHLPKKSITTIHLMGYADCAAVQADNRKLDSDLNGDCYVDLLDMEIMADYWLNTTCAASGNCHGADFAPTDGTVDFYDFADFGPQWRQCNNPLDAGCAPNWE